MIFVAILALATFVLTVFTPDDPEPLLEELGAGGGLVGLGGFVFVFVCVFE